VLRYNYLPPVLPAPYDYDGFGLLCTQAPALFPVEVLDPQIPALWSLKRFGVFLSPYTRIEIKHAYSGDIKDLTLWRSGGDADSWEVYWRYGEEPKPGVDVILCGGFLYLDIEFDISMIAGPAWPSWFVYETGEGKGSCLFYVEPADIPVTLLAGDRDGGDRITRPFEAFLASRSRSLSVNPYTDANPDHGTNDYQSEPDSGDADSGEPDTSEPVATAVNPAPPESPQTVNLVLEPPAPPPESLQTVNLVPEPPAPPPAVFGGETAEVAFALDAAGSAVAQAPPVTPVMHTPTLPAIAMPSTSAPQTEPASGPFPMYPVAAGVVVLSAAGIAYALRGRKVLK
jgi:hypothetical protein